MSSDNNPANNSDHSARRAAPPSGRPPREMWKTGLVIALVVVILAGGGLATAYLTGIIGGPKPVTPTTVPSGNATTAPSPTPPPPPMERWPLTGVGVAAVIQRPALAVKIENAEESRPQGGLEDADIVYEEMVEGGVSRLIGVYHSTLPLEIVPLRSVRPMDGPIVSWTGGLLAFSGGQEEFTSRAENDGLQLISMDWGDDGFTRADNRPSPHDVVGDPVAFLDQADADHQAPPPPFAAFAVDGASSTAQLQGTPATTLSVVISGSAKPNWTWNPAAKAWLRDEMGDPAMTEAGTQLQATNVLVVEVNVRSLPGTDAAGSHIPESIVVGSGDGLVATGGQTAPITWQKDSDSGAWQFLDAAGQPVQLLPGNTWVELVPSSTGSWSTK